MVPGTPGVGTAAVGSAGAWRRAARSGSEAVDGQPADGHGQRRIADDLHEHATIALLRHEVCCRRTCLVVGDRAVAQAVDGYRALAEELGLSVSTEERTKPPCCGPDGEPPIDPQLIEDTDAAFKVMTRRERRSRSRRR